MNVNTILTLLTALRNDAAHSSLSVVVKRDRRLPVEILGAKLVYPPGGCEPTGIALILDDGDAPEPDAPVWGPSPPSVASSVEPVALPETSPPSSDAPRTAKTTRKNGKTPLKRSVTSV